MRRGASLSIAGGLIGALGIGQAIWGTVLDGRISASGELRAGAIAAAAVALGSVILGRFLRLARAQTGAAFVRWLTLPAACALGLAWYLVMHSGTKENAYRAAMEAELRNFAQAEQAYYSDSGRYAAETTSLGSLWLSSWGVIGPTITLTGDGSQAVVGHSSTNSSCTIFVGTTPLAPAVRPGEPECSPVYRHRPWLGLVLLGVGLLIGAAAVATAPPGLAAHRDGKPIKPFRRAWARVSLVVMSPIARWLVDELRRLHATNPERAQPVHVRDVSTAFVGRLLLRLGVLHKARRFADAVPE